MSGTPIIVFYSVSIFQEAGAGINKHLASIVVASINVIGGIVGIFLVQKLPRVKLNMVATSLMSVCMAALGTALYLKDSLPDSAHLLDWVAVVAVVAVVLYMFSFGAGREKRPLSQLSVSVMRPTFRSRAFDFCLRRRAPTKGVQGYISLL